MALWELLAIVLITQIKVWLTLLRVNITSHFNSDVSLSKPIGEVVDYFWQMEFQLRGSPHIHSLWWVKVALNLQTVEGLCAVPGFIDQYIPTRIPPEGEDDELRGSVMRLQRHKHTHTCHHDMIIKFHKKLTNFSIHWHGFYTQIPTSWMKHLNI